MCGIVLEEAGLWRSGQCLLENGTFLTKMLFCRKCPRVLHPVSLGKSLYCSCNGLRMDLFVWGHMCFNWGMRKTSTRLMGQGKRSVQAICLFS